MDLSLWLIIFGMMGVTYSVRLSVMALMGDRTMPEAVNHALRYVPPAALAAIIFPALLMPDGALALSVSNLRLVAGVGAALIAWRTRHTLLAIGAGMVLLWVLQALG